MLGPSAHQRSRIVDTWDETASFRAVRLDLGPFGRDHQAPGQVVKVRTPEGEGFFALASAPSPEGTADLLVKRGGKVADAVAASAVKGGQLELTPPFGKGFPVGEARHRDVLLFAAGAGIAPIRALIQHLLRYREEFGRITLFYGQRHGADFAYRREHLAWERGGVRVILCPSSADDAWPGVRGRVQEVAPTVAFGGTAPGDAVAFLCGMHSMVSDVKATLSRAGVPPERVHLNF